MFSFWAPTLPHLLSHLVWESILHRKYLEHWGIERYWDPRYPIWYKSPYCSSQRCWVPELAVLAFVSVLSQEQRDMGSGSFECRNSRTVQKESSVGDRSYKQGQIWDRGSMGTPTLRGLKTVLFQGGGKRSRWWYPLSKGHFVELLRSHFMGDPSP